MTRVIKKIIKKNSIKLIAWFFGISCGMLLSLGIALKFGLSILHSDLFIWSLAILAMTFVFAFLIKSLLLTIIKNPDFSKIWQSYFVLIIFYLAFFVLLGLFKKNSIFTTFHSFWLPGRRGLIINLASLSFLGFLLPLIFANYLILFESEAEPGPFGLVVNWLKMLPQRIHKSFDSSHLPFYDSLFILVFFGMCLLPINRSTNLSNIGSDFFARKWLLNLYANMRFDLGDRVFNLSFRSSNNWLVYTGELSLDDYQNTIPFTDDELVAIQRKLDRLDDLLSSKGIELLVVIPPNKNTIYPEYVPNEIPVIGSKSRFDQLVSYEQQHDTFKIMDLRPMLLQARAKNLVYYPCDTHWNPYGAFIAYEAILNELQKDFPELSPHSIDEYNRVPNQSSCDITSLEHLNISGGQFTLSPQFQRSLTEQDWQKSTDQASFIVHFPYDNITVTNSDLSLPSLLMFRDSFGTALIPFMQDHFRRSVYLWAFPADEAYYDIEKPDIVIIEFTERYLQFLLQIPG